MNDKSGFDRAVAQWLDDGTDATPPGVIDAVLLAARSTPQERDFRIPWRTASMTYLRVAAVIAIVAVGGVAALYAFGPGPNVGSGLTPDPTTQPTLPPTASPSQILGAPPSDCVDVWAEGGTYRATVGTLSVEATVPAGWHGIRDQFFLLNAPCGLGGPLTLEVAPLSHVYTDACQWRGTSMEATTPAAVTEALAEQEGHETNGPTDVTIGGYPASKFEFTFPADIDRTRCDDGTLWLTPRDPEGLGLANIDPGTTMTVYVVDVDGSAVAVAARLWPPEDSTPAALAELNAIAASLRFEP